MTNEQEPTEQPSADSGKLHDAEYAWADDQVDYPHLIAKAREAHLIE